MYYYIYDNYLNDRKYEKELDRVKTRLLDLEIQGKHEKLTLLKSLDELVKDEIKRGALTIVAVGNDKTFLKLVDVIAQSNVTLGIIPVGKEDNNLAKLFGINNSESACDIIAARKIAKFDLGLINKMTYFFSSIKIDKNVNRLSVYKDSYKIIPKYDSSNLKVINFFIDDGSIKNKSKLKNSSACDGSLELAINTKLKKPGWFSGKSAREAIDTLIQSKNFKIKSFEYLPAMIDSFRVLKTPLEIEVVPGKLKVIVGKSKINKNN